MSFFTRNTSQFGLTTFQMLKSPMGPVATFLGNEGLVRADSWFLNTQHEYLLSSLSLGVQEKYSTTDKFTQLGRRRNLWGPAIAFQLDHTPAMTILNRKFTLKATDRSSFFKSGLKTPKTWQSPHPQWTGNHSPRALDVRPAPKK